MTGTDVATHTRERPGMSALVLEDGVVYHTYSAYARGLDGLWGAYQWLDPRLALTPPHDSSSASWQGCARHRARGAGADHMGDVTLQGIEASS